MSSYEVGGLPENFRKPLFVTRIIGMLQSRVPDYPPLNGLLYRVPSNLPQKSPAVPTLRRKKCGQSFDQCMVRTKSTKSTCRDMP